MMKRFIWIGGFAVILGVGALGVFSPPTSPLDDLARSEIDELSCSSETVANSMSFLLYTDPPPEEVMFLPGSIVQGYEGVSAVNSREASVHILEGRAREIYRFGRNDISLRTARFTAGEQLDGTITCSIYLPSDTQYGAVGERITHIRRSGRTASSIEVIVARSHSEIVEFLTQELEPAESDNAINVDVLLPPPSRN